MKIDSILSQFKTDDRAAVLSLLVSLINLKDPTPISRFVMGSLSYFDRIDRSRVDEAHEFICLYLSKLITLKVINISNGEVVAVNPALLTPENINKYGKYRVFPKPLYEPRGATPSNAVLENVIHPL